MRRNTGHQFTITILVGYPNLAALPAEKKLRLRIMELQDHFAQLNCRLRDVKTRKPYWEERPTFRGSANFLQRQHYEFTGDQVEEKECLIMKEHDRMAKEDFEEGDRPLWQVTVYEPPTGSSAGGAYLAVSALHELIDGRGLLRVVHALLADDISDVPYEQLSSIATYPDTVDIRPSWSHLLPFTLQHLVLPFLPASISCYLAPEAVWPVGRISINPLTLPGRIAVVSIPHDLVELMKSLGRFHGVPTLTPILLNAWLVAMWTVLRDDEHNTDFLSSSVAVDERKSDLDHSYCTGLYHASHLYAFKMGGISTFWNTTRQLSLHLAHPSSLSTARMRMGMTAYIPDGQVPIERRNDLRRPTAWEDWQLRQNETLNAYVSSASFSNLGRTDLPHGADNILVASSPSVGDPPIKLVLTGSVKGIEVVLTFRDGDILRKEQVREMKTKWLQVLRKLVSGRGEDMVLDDLVINSS